MCQIYMTAQSANEEVKATSYYAVMIENLELTKRNLENSLEIVNASILEQISL